MSYVNISFNLLGEKIDIQGNSNDTMENIIKKYLNKNNKTNNDLIFLINGDQISKNSIKNTVGTFSRGEKQISILVYNMNLDEEKKILKVSKQIICPQCKENCLINFKDYKIILNKCDKNHNIDNILLKNFSKLRIIDESEILCKECNRSKEETKNNSMFFCCDCNFNFCPLCKISHLNKNEQHQIIDYDFKNYLCNKHGERFTCYCTDCNRNLCDNCEIEDDKNHKFIYHKEIAKNKDDNNINELKSKIDNLKNEKNNISNDLLSQDIFDKVIGNLEIIYGISNDIVMSYSLKNKNYQLLMNFNNMNNYNKLIIEEIDKIINEKNMENKVKAIKDIYNKMEIIDEFIIKYKIDKEEKIRIFGDKFAKNNRNNCKIIIKDKVTGLKPIIKRNELVINNDTFEIKLKIIKNIIDLSHMFDDCTSLLFPDISNLDTSNITNMSYIFNNCTSLTSLPDISNWNTNNVTDMSKMFSFCSSLISLPDISKWDTSKVTDISNMFKECKKIESLPDLSKWNTNNVKNMSCLFQYCYSLKKISNISSWNTNNVTNMSFIFDKCIELTNLPDLSKWKTENVKDISGIFRNCIKLLSLFDISNWETKNVKNMMGLFENCKLLASFPDISKWNTNNVTDMSFMFSQCSSMTSLPDISKWDVSKVNTMECMFYYCSSLSNLPDLSKWNISKDINKKNMFLNCSELSTLPSFAN